MYTLYARAGAGSAAVEALLAVIDAPHTVENVPKNDDGSAPSWFLALNPRGEVPTLKLTDGSIMTESAAMMIHLADSHPTGGMAPALGAPTRAQYLRWMVYLAATPYSSDLRLFYSHRFSTDPSHADAIKAKASIDLAHDFDVFVAGMGSGPYVLGSAMSAVDIYAAMLFSWSDNMDALFAKHPKLKQLYASVASHPKIRKVWDRNGMP